jgi:hypothetical protein
MNKLFRLASLVLLFSGAANANEPSEAEALFDRYQELGRAFDPAMADLYCDTALIRNVRTYPSGEQRTLEIPAPMYKDLVRSAMPLAKARGDVSTYSDVQFVAEGSSVRITAERYSELKKYTSPVSILVGQCGDSGLAILEELSESRP